VRHLARERWRRQRRWCVERVDERFAREHVVHGRRRRSWWAREQQRVERRCRRREQQRVERWCRRREQQRVERWCRRREQRIERLVEQHGRRRDRVPRSLDILLGEQRRSLR
jgi:hypothetical protein